MFLVLCVFSQFSINELTLDNQSFLVPCRTLIAISEKYFAGNYYDHNLIGAQADQEVLKEIIKEKLPELYQHLADIDIEISTITLNWFLAIFFDCVPFQVGHSTTTFNVRQHFNFGRILLWERFVFLSNAYFKQA